ncbi:MAG TPA: serine/threonine-protein kinase [Stellaceae bacterium]|nr:serine/threonine-protein kinase [Stellaceae bacterium]
MSDTPTTIGRYQVKRWLASGAMGEVYEAYDPIIDRPVAIKMLRRELVERGDSVGWLERFRHEARAAGRRMHPNIVTVLDFGDQEGTPFLAMEYVAGENVDTALKRSGPFDEARAVSIITQVLSALEFAHAEGVIHRDIKPSNILLPAKGPIKVADFGIAHLEQSDLTIDGDVLGTPSYMAPEQLLGGQVGHRADLYAAGLLLFEMLTGEKAFQNRQVFDLVRTMRDREPEDIWAKHPEISPTLTAVINRALAFNPDERYATAAEFAAALEARGLSGAAPSERQTDATVVVPPAMRPPAPPTTPPASPTAPPTPTSPPTGTQTVPPQTASFGAETLAAVEHDLSMFIGPLARIAVRRAAANCSDMGVLYRELAKLINNETDRASFIAKSRERARAMPGATPTNRPAQGPAPSFQRDAPSATFPPDVLSRIEAGLAEHIGPIARVLVRQHMSRSSSVIDLCRELALFIPDEQARANFLRSQRAG